MNGLIDNIKIANMIYEIRGKQVMLNSDLARLYNCTNGTKDINKAVKRNIERFPSDFYFQITEDEKEYLRFHFGTTNKMSRYNSFAFTEQGAAMLASVLRTDVAAAISVNIMNAFVNMRKYISSNLIEQKYINDIVLKDRERINLIEESLNKFKEKNNHIFLKVKYMMHILR